MRCLLVLILLINQSFTAHAQTKSEETFDSTNSIYGNIPGPVLMEAADDISKGDREYKIALIAVFEKEVFWNLFEMVEDLEEFKDYSKTELLKLSMQICLFKNMGEDPMEAMAKVLNSPEDYL